MMVQKTWRITLGLERSKYDMRYQKPGLGLRIECLLFPFVSIRAEYINTDI